MPAVSSANAPIAAGWGFWLVWVLAGVAGWGLGGPLGVVLGRSGDVIVAGYAGVAVGGILVGVLQWAALRQLGVAADWWVPTSLAAAVIVGVVVFGAGVTSSDVGWVLGAGLFGTVVGLLQWLVLREQVAGAGWWVLASTIGWVAGGPVVGFVSWLVGAPAAGFVGGFLGWPALGLVYGATTGSALVWLLRQ